MACSDSTPSDRVCKIPGCTAPPKGRGWCGRHYQRWIKYGDPLGGGLPRRPKGVSASDIVACELERAERIGDCLITVVGKIPDGYGMVYVNGRNTLIHRLVLEHKLGRPLRPGECARHTCHNPSCINPEHLIPGSHQDNMADMCRAGRTNRAKLTLDQVRQIRSRYMSECDTYQVLADEFGVNIATVWAVVNGKTWKHVI